MNLCASYKVFFETKFQGLLVAYHTKKERKEKGLLVASNCFCQLQTYGHVLRLDKFENIFVALWPGLGPDFWQINGQCLVFPFLTYWHPYLMYYFLCICWLCTFTCSFSRSVIVRNTWSFASLFCLALYPSFYHYIGVSTISYASMSVRHLLSLTVSQCICLLLWSYLWTCISVISCIILQRL